MPSILDVEFLRSPLPLSRSLIYRFRTGVFRCDLLLALEQITPAGLQRCEPSQLSQRLGGFGLFDFTSYCDLSSKDHQSSFDVSEAIAAFIQPDSYPAIVFAHESHKLFKDVNWSSVDLNCTVVDEVLVDGSTLENIVDYLAHASDLIRADCEGARVARMAYFREMLDREGALSLLEIRNAFDSAVLLYTDRQTGEFQADTVADVELSSRRSVFLKLRDLVSHTGASTLAAFVASAAALHSSGWSAREIADELCKVTRRLLQSQAPGGRKRQQLVDGALTFELNALIWAVMLLTWVQPLIENEDNEEKNPDHVRLFVVLLDQIGREFEVRCLTPGTADPLSGLWIPLEAAIAPMLSAGFEAQNPSQRLMVALRSSIPASAAGDRQWIARLRRVLSEPAAGLSRQKQSKAANLPRWSPTSFAEVFGNPQILHDLRRRFASKNHTLPLVSRRSDYDSLSEGVG